MLDGALGVMAAVGVLRAFAQSGERPARDLALVDRADEDTADGDLSAAIETFAVCVRKALRLPIDRGSGSVR